MFNGILVMCICLVLQVMYSKLKGGGHFTNEVTA